MVRSALLGFTLVLFASLAQAQMPVEVNGTTPDPVGQRLVFAVKERIRSSKSLAMSFDSKVARMQVNVVTLDQNREQPGNSSSYAVVVLWNNPADLLPYYLTHFVGYCGSAKVNECADGVVATISEQADELTRLAQEAQAAAKH